MKINQYRKLKRDYLNSFSINIKNYKYNDILNLFSTKPDQDEICNPLLG